jgi:nucleoid DNA-binding protein
MQYKELLDRFHATSKHYGLDEKQSRELVEKLFTIITECLVRNESVDIRNWGSFNVRRVKGRILPGRRMKYCHTETTEIPSHRLIRFELRSGLWNLLNPHMPKGQARRVAMQEGRQEVIDPCDRV